LKCSTSSCEWSGDSAASCLCTSVAMVILGEAGATDDYFSLWFDQ
jgi:hypothetical protein